jgi:tetratricopeptide (TPR) repeat protein
MRVTAVSLVLLAFAFATPAGAQPARPPDRLPNLQQESEHVRKGVSHFDRAFYELRPQKREREAAREFDLAIAEFEREITLRPSSVTPHRYLARIHAARNEFLEAAAHYDKVTELDPFDVDAFVLASLAYLEAGEVAEARRRLEAARTASADPDVLARLADYLARLDAMKR